MAVDLETLARRTEPKPRKISENRAEELIRENIRTAISTRISPWDRDYLHQLFIIDSRFADGHVAPSKEKEKDKEKVYSLDRAKLQAIGLRVMAEFGFDEKVFTEPESGSDTFRKRVYSTVARPNEHVYFERLEFLDKKTGNPTRVVWTVTKPR